MSRPSNGLQPPSSSSSSSLTAAKVSPSSSSPSSSPPLQTSPTPLPPALIARVLDYICPPSQLSSPLPPHLISPSLHQRHSFLHLSPDDPASYLAWPSDSDSHATAVRLLETFQKPTDDLAYSIFPIAYSADPESTHAHISIAPDQSPGLRLVFQWDSLDGWQYHNVALMPFPPNTFDSIQDALLFQPQFTSEHNMSVDHDDPEDSYWDAYGHTDDSDTSPIFTLTKDDSQASTEDAYWAQYASVHGSGDSTLPSPRHPKQIQDLAERVIVTYPGGVPPAVYNPLEPPSPTTLSRRLADLSPRLPSPPLIDESESTYGTDSTTASPLTLSTQMTSTHSSSPSPLSFGDGSVAGQHSEPSVESGSNVALKDTIRSVYRLWQTTRPSQLSPERQGLDAEEFLEIVRQVMMEPYVS